MRILIDSCAYGCRNLGDVAMLMVAVSRLRELWPRASLEVITDAPELLARHCGELGTVPVRGRRLLLQQRLLGPLRGLLPGALRSRLARWEDDVRLRWPRLPAAAIRAKAALRRHDAGDLIRYLEAQRGADLVVVNGSGILTDAFRDNALGVLATLELAVRRGTPTALFGQGLGPIHDPQLARRAREVLPRVTQIALREALSGPPLLASLGVDPAQVLVTGDDAIELAYAAAARAPGPGRERLIGVNVRVAPYSGVDAATLALLGDALAAAAAARQARLLPVPIAQRGGMDAESLRALLPGSARSGAPLETPRQAIERIGACRVMVSGSYHGAVFALSQGIPAVGLAGSQYYLAKMAGLAHQFGPGCEVVPLHAAGLAGRLAAAVARAWDHADRVRAPLLERAAAQVRSGRAACQRLRERIEPAGSAAAAEGG